MEESVDSNLLTNIILELQKSKNSFVLVRFVKEKYEKSGEFKGSFTKYFEKNASDFDLLKKTAGLSKVRLKNKNLDQKHSQKKCTSKKPIKRTKRATKRKPRSIQHRKKLKPPVKNNKGVENEPEEVEGEDDDLNIVIKEKKKIIIPVSNNLQKIPRKVKNKKKIVKNEVVRRKPPPPPRQQKKSSMDLERKLREYEQEMKKLKSENMKLKKKYQLELQEKSKIIDSKNLELKEKNRTIDELNQYINKKLIEEKEDFLYDLKNNSKTLSESSSDELKNDKDVVIESVRLDAESLQFASEHLRNDKEVVWEAIRTNQDVFRFTGDDLRENDRNFVLEVMKRYPSCLKFTKDKEIVKQIYLQDNNEYFPLIEYIHQDLIRSSHFLHLVFKRSGDIWGAVDENSSRKEKDEWEEFFIEEVLRKKKQVFLRCLFKATRSINAMIEEERKKLEEISKTSYSLKFENLKIIKLLGRGVYGGTYSCRIIGIGGIFAVKIYNDAPAEKLQKKIEWVENDSLYIPYHQNVVSILTHSENERIEINKLPDHETYWRNVRKLKTNFFYSGIVLMRYHRGTLKEFLRLVELHSFKEVCLMLEGIIEGACHLHKNMIVHRDLHSGNIFVHPAHGRIWIGDFGCALDLRKNKTKFKVKKDNHVMFSFISDSIVEKEYNSESGFRKGGWADGMAPEIKNFDPKKEDLLDYEKSDLYSVGILGRLLLKSIHDSNSIITLFDELSKLIKNLCCEDPKERNGFDETRNNFLEILMKCEK